MKKNGTLAELPLEVDNSKNVPFQMEVYSYNASCEARAAAQ